VRCPVAGREARVIVRSAWQVRAASLNELIYKQGQAGVTKASVTLVFDNADPTMSPHGYDQYPQLTVTRQVCCRPLHQLACWPPTLTACAASACQVVVGGRNKYMINGTIAQQSRVQNLFHSVQLNVNNPHFLVRKPSSTRCHLRCPDLCSRPVAWLCRSCKVGSPRCST
jgi:structural maintenance of chromosome 2